MIHIILHILHALGWSVVATLTTFIVLMIARAFHITLEPVWFWVYGIALAVFLLTL